MIGLKLTKTSNKTERSLKKMSEIVKNKSSLDSYGRAGVAALRSATPVDTSNTANSWVYKIRSNSGGYSLEFSNNNIHNGANIAIILQHGHGTGTGGWVQGRDYINPAIQPVFDDIADKLWKEIIKA